MGPNVRDILSIKHTNATCQMTGINNILSSVSNYKMRHAGTNYVILFVPGYVAFSFIVILAV